MSGIKDWAYDALMNLRNRTYRVRDVAKAERMGVRIFVFQHQAGELPACFSGSVYHALQVGRALQDPLPNIMWADDVGDNISSYNRHLNEMTGIYWVYRNYAACGNPSYVGFAHYRRFLTWDERLLAPGVVFASSYTTRQGVRMYFEHSLGNMREAFDAFFTAFRTRREFASYGDLAGYCSGHLTYCCNLMLTDRTTFMRYGAFVADCLAVCRELIDADVAGVRSATRFTDQRKFSYLMEFMTGYWIWHNERAGRVRVRRAVKRLLTQAGKEA